MFESGDWKGSEDEDSDDDDDNDNDDDEGDGRWNLEAMRKETERLRDQKEQDRLARLNGEPIPTRKDMNGFVDSEAGGGDGSRESESDDYNDANDDGSESNGEGASGES